MSLTHSDTVRIGSGRFALVTMSGYMGERRVFPEVSQEEEYQRLVAQNLDAGAVWLSPIGAFLSGDASVRERLREEMARDVRVSAGDVVTISSERASEAGAYVVTPAANDNFTLVPVAREVVSA